ncbi:MAG: flagellar FlbD family protein [Desulfobulbus sp.]|jgi:flagellar protein FlbD
MMQLTRLDGSVFYLNPELIKTVETTPDTLITLVQDDRLLVRETADEVIARFTAHRVELLRRGCPALAVAVSPPERKER